MYMMVKMEAIELCYATLLSSKESTGPSSAWNGREEDARHNENPRGCGFMCYMH